MIPHEPMLIMTPDLLESIPMKQFQTMDFGYGLSAHLLLITDVIHDSITCTICPWPEGNEGEEE
jgi:hypothetical protein